MSGFAGYVSARGDPPDQRLLERMAARLAFRGPDATQIWSRSGAGFCFTLLRTGPAPQASEQPCTLDGRVWLLGDVRLDGREELRRELEQHDKPIPATATDEELILRAWHQWGEAGLPKLLGDFSFALWDDTARRLWCVRDLLGARPFFYARVGGRFYFSNTLEVIRLTPGVSSELDPQFIGDFLLQEWCVDGARTAYRDIHRLPPGHTLVISDRELCVRFYTDFSVEEPLGLKRPEEYVERFLELLMKAVRDRLPHGSCGIFLSGGLDSASVAAVACKIARQDRTRGPLRACTVDCRPMFRDEEGTLASLLARNLGMEIEILSSTSCVPYEGCGDPLLRTPEPCHNPFLLLGQRQYRRVRSHARVVLSGYGGDDILTGQAWPYLIYLYRKRCFGTIAKTFGRYILKHGRVPPLRGGFRSRLRRWMGRKNPLTEFPVWIGQDFVELHNLRERWLKYQESPRSSHPLHPIAFASLTGKYWSSLLENEDAGWTGVPVELRAPLLDQRLLRFLLRVPPVPWCMEKNLLREAMRGMLPEKVRARPKTPLIGDSIKYFMTSKKWSPLPLPEPSAELREIVNWERLNATLAEAEGSTLWVGLRPVSLLYWLKGVVNAVGIR
ncbi:MAG TPA: asparagine synthase-related protein [Candidatus Acidoferrum sp.]|nr:asparagine synthase-related protein [Candidatus Acidoferrum sp.]